MSSRIRNGRSIKTIIETSLSKSVFHEIDNLDSKTLEQAENNYEKVFVRVRDLLTEKPWCCDNQNDVLSICQVIADDLRANLLIRKEER